MSYRSCMRERRQLLDHVIKTSRFAVKMLTFCSFGSCSWFLDFPPALWPAESNLLRFRPLYIHYQLCARVCPVLLCYQSVTSSADFEFPLHHLVILDIYLLLVPKMARPNKHRTSNGPSTCFNYQLCMLPQRKPAVKADIDAVTWYTHRATLIYFKPLPFDYGTTQEIMD